jgi:bla regulator protein blaR1
VGQGRALPRGVAKLGPHTEDMGTTRISAVCFVGVLAIACCSYVEAQAPSSAALAFEVASIKPFAPVGSEPSGFLPFSGTRIRITGESLRLLVAQAYHIENYQVSGGPSWIYSDLYRIEARTPGESTPTMDQVRQMVQTLLADRFQLKLHAEIREVAGYGLTAAKGGVKLKESAPDARALSMNARGRLMASKMKMTDMASFLSLTVRRPVIDQTGLPGTYDVTLTWSPDEDAPTDDSQAPSIFTAIQEQLGLRVVSQKVPIQVFVVDHAEKPTEN